MSRSGLPLLGGVAAGVLVLGTVLLMPQTALEAGVWRSGIAALATAAHPPLGATARLLLAGAGGLVAAAVTWSALYLMFGAGGPFAGATTIRVDRKPGLRRADRHPDAPPRPPMRAADLGTPLMEVRRPLVEAALPSDLDTPLAAFDPAALPPLPREPVRPVAPLAPARAALAPGERLQTFLLKPPVAELASHPIPSRTDPASQPTVEALLRRLEEKAARRAVGTQARA